MVSMKEWYARVNAAWPTDLPIPSESQAITAAKRLWTWGMGRPWTGKVETTSGRRFTWIKHGVLVVNPNRPGHEGGGWKSLIHDLSHLLWSRANPGERPHQRDHAKLELAMVKQVVKRGWLTEGAPHPEPKPDVRLERFERIKARMEAWERKERRAKNAIKKLRKQASYYERQLSA